MKKIVTFLIIGILGLIIIYQHNQPEKITYKEQLVLDYRKTDDYKQAIENKKLKKSDKSSPTANTNISVANSEAIATGINLNGLLCAEVVSVNKLTLPNKAEVTCITYRGGSSTSTYIVDVSTGRAYEQ